jgi:hypothetical protein
MTTKINIFFFVYLILLYILNKKNVKSGDYENTKLDYCVKCLNGLVVFALFVIFCSVKINKNFISPNPCPVSFLDYCIICAKLYYKYIIE